MTIWDSQVTDCQDDDERETLAEWEASELRRELLTPRHHWLWVVALGLLALQMLGHT